MPPEFDNQWIDEALRNVAVPPSVAARLNEIGTCSDSDLDAALRGSSPRATLRDRLLAVGTLNDQDLADELRDVRVPGELLARCREIPRTEPVTGLPLLRQVLWLETRPLLQYAVAASLLLFLGGWAILQFAGNDQLAPQPPIAANNPQLNTWVYEDPIDPEQLKPLPILAPPEPFPTPLPKTPNLAVGPLQQADQPLPNPEKQRTGPIDDRDLFGTNPGTQPLPDLVSVGEPENRGMRPPNVREFDLLFLLRHGVHPFVSPSAHADLVKVQVPLVNSTASFQRALELARQPAATRGDLRPEEIRVEEFLAAMDYEFARPTSSKSPGLSLNTAAGVSPWSDHGLGLIQVGVQAGNLARAPESAAHLILVLDTSSAMARSGSWTLLCQNLRKNLAELLPTDRVTILLAGERPRMLGRAMTAAQATNLLAKVETASLRGNTNLGAALAEVANLLQANDQTPPAKVALLTAGMLHLDQAQLARWSDELRPLLSESQQTLEVIDLRPHEVLDPLLTSLAGWSRKSVHHAPQGRQLDLRLREILSGQSQVVAHDVSLRVNFVPGAVALYRLLGHEASAVSNLIPLEWQTDLHSGETATALFEVALRPNGPEIVAHATLEWRDMAGQLHTRKQPISRLQFAPAFSEAPRSLQLAALAAETAEVLRGSYFAPVATHDLEQIRAVAQRLPQRTRQTPAYRQLEQFWQSNVKPARL